MSEPRILLDGLAFPESPRWHDGRLWFANWGAQEVIAVDPAGSSEVMVARTDHAPLLHRLAARRPPARRVGT